MHRLDKLMPEISGIEEANQQELFGYELYGDSVQ